MSLRSRLLFSIFGTLLLSLAAGAAFTYWHAVKKIETEMEAAIAVGGRSAHNAIDDADELTVNPERRLKLLIADFDGDRHLRASLVVNGKVVRASEFAKPESPAPAWFYRLLAGAPKVRNVELPPVLSRYGSVVLQSDANNDIAEVWSDVGLTLTVLTIFCALVLAFVYLTLASAIHPLRDLTAAFGRVGDHDYRERVPERGPYELVRLYQGFNRMVEDLALAEAQNKRLQEQLATVQDEERADLARDLHDEIGPMLFAADVDAATIERLAERGEYGASRSASASFARPSVRCSATCATFSAACVPPCCSTSDWRMTTTIWCRSGPRTGPASPSRWRCRMRASASPSTEPSTVSCRKACRTPCAMAPRRRSRSRSRSAQTARYDLRHR